MEEKESNIEKKDIRDVKGRFAKGNNLWAFNPMWEDKGKRWNSVQECWEECLEYFEASDREPELIEKFGGNPPMPYTEKHVRPYSRQGLCNYLGISEVTLWKYEQGADEHHSAYVNLFRIVNSIITEQNLTGAQIGRYKESITAKKLKMWDKQEVKQDSQVTFVYEQKPLPDGVKDDDLV